MSATVSFPKDESTLQPQLKDGMVKALTTAYATLLKRQRTASAAYVRWTTAHSRAHEFAWLEPGQETLLFEGRSLSVPPTSGIHAAINKMMATIQLNPYEREVVYGYPYLIGQIEGKPIRAPLLTIPISITTDGGSLSIVASSDQARFNSLPFRSESDTAAHELALARLIEATPELPLTMDSLKRFAESVCRELSVANPAQLSGRLADLPAQPKTAMRLSIVDNAACFIAPKTSYFLVNDLENIGKTDDHAVATTALGWLLGRRPIEPSSDYFDDRKKVYYPFASNPSQRRVAHLVEDPKSRITVVQGPPGTGKSLTIANLAAHLVATGKRVLITSQKDKALDVVDDLLNGLDFPQLPMTLLRQDRESKQELRDRLERIQKDRSAEETRRDLQKQVERYESLVDQHGADTKSLENALLAEHSVHCAVKDIESAKNFLRRIAGKWRLMRTLHAAERTARVRSDQLGQTLNEIRARLRQEAIALLARAAEHRTCEANKTERNQLREFAKLLGRNQSNFKNYPVFDRMKAEPDRCEMLLKILPCWIMTPDDVARLFPCRPGIFDVVIIDEASQCDLPSMTPVLFRAKQAVIAGDSKQMQAQRFAFTSGQVAAQAWTEQGLDRFDPDRWLDPAKIDLLQLASIRMDEEAFLDEHYRSLPAIIGFSNHRWYGDRLRIMRDPDDKRVGDQGTTAIVLHKVDGKVTPESQENPLEAQELVMTLHTMLQHPGYSDASFGVISLFEEQMRLINDLAAEQIPETLRAEHDLVVVNPDGFQGDERDVILYSLSFDADGMSQAALSARQAEREHIQGMLNVAFTRARDEMHVFHSANLDEFATSTGKGTIRDWLEYCSKNWPSPVDGDAGRELAKAQSEFEAEVLGQLASQGVKVTAQYPSCGYFIDIVAEKGNNRLAIECDGEIWHLDEHGHLKLEDLQRQEVLERAGWTVVRIPYRSWRDNAEIQLQRILSTLMTAPAEEDGGPPEGSMPSMAMSQEATPRAVGPATPVDRFEHAIVHALNGGKKSKDDVFKVARQQMGFSRLGNQIRSSLHSALVRLQAKGIIRVEEDEVFFADEQARKATYTLSTLIHYGRAAHKRRYGRYRRW